jgi:hypothetical protein
MADRTNDPIDRQYRSMIESTYNPIPRDDHEKIIDNLLTLVEMGHDKRQSLKQTLEFAVKIIFKHFDFHDITVGLKDRKDGYYRYEVIFGFRKEIEDGLRRMKYSYDDMVSNEKFPFIRIGRHSELDPMEGLPEWERDWYKPHALEMRRKAPDEFHEGDYIDIWMYCHNKELIGWFEIANPLGGKLPTRSQVRWIELVASICSTIVTQKWAEEDAAKGRPPMPEIRIRPR